MKLIALTVLVVVAALCVVGCSADDGSGPVPAPEGVASVSEAVVDCNINCYEDAYPPTGSGWYLTATDYCATPSPRIICKWSRFPGWPTSTTVIVPASCPNCTNDLSHVCNGVCGSNDLSSTWTCHASSC